MTDTQQAPETLEEVEEVPEAEAPILSMDQLDHYMVEPGGIPFFFANHKGAMRNIEGNGYSYYYILGYAKEEGLVNGVRKTDYFPGIFKVVDTLVSRVVVRATTEEVALEEINVGAQLKLPPFPLVLRQKLDDFFRTVADMYGTESIVLLTYDTSKDGSDGWGVMIPPQHNTAGHCNYDQEALAAEKPDHVYIVGSVHSHPGMAAYASGTDHHDQATFDGIHITYGWLKNKGNITEYHGELQMLGKSYKIDIDSFFEPEPARVVDSEILEWTERVTKEEPPPVTHGANAWTSPGGKAPAPTSGTGTTRQSGTVGAHKSGSWEKDLPNSLPDLRNNYVLFALRGDGDTECMFCKTKLTNHEFRMHKCGYCNHYFVGPNQSLDDMLKKRLSDGYITTDININSEQKPTKPIYIWRQSLVKEGDKSTIKHDFDMVYMPGSSGATDQGKD